MRKLKKKFLTVCALFAAVVTCTVVGVFSSIESRHEAAVAQAESASTVVLNDATWSGTVALTNNGGSAYTVTLTTTEALSTEVFINNSLINEVNMRDYLVFNGETMTEWQAKMTSENLDYLSSDLDGKYLAWKGAWNPVVVNVNETKITMTINRNYLPAAGLEFGIKDGFEMTNDGTTYKTEGDLLFKVIPDVSTYDKSRGSYDGVKVVPLDEAKITTKRTTVSYSRVSGWDSQHSGYICYHISSTALMNYGNFGTVLCDHNTYLNDYIMLGEHPLSYWNTVKYSGDYTYTGAPNDGKTRAYGTPTFAKMYQSDTSTTIAVFLHADWMTAQGITDPVLGIKDGMLYVGRDGATIYEEGTPTEVMNDKWTVTPPATTPTNNNKTGSMYSVTLNYTSEFNAEAAWVNNASETYNSHVYALADYILLNGKTMAEWMESAKDDSRDYLDNTTDDKLSWGAAWNAVAVCVNKNNIKIEINRNYIPAAGLEVGLKAGFEMTNNDTIFKVTEDVIYKLIPDVSNVQNLVAVKADTADITKNNIEYTVSSAVTSGNYDRYGIVIPFAMDFTNSGWALSNNYTYLNDYITVNGHPLTYWNTVKYDADFNYSGAAADSSLYQTPTYGQMYANSDTNATTIYVYVNKDLNLTNPTIGLAKGMLYPADGKVYEYDYQYSMSFVEGASVRAVVDNNAETGIRFTANVDTKLATEATEVGMLIVPETYITAYKASGYSDYFKYFSEVKGKTKAGISTTFSAAQIASGTLKGCIVGIKDENWTRSYQAVTYYIADGEYYYSEPSDARSITYVADKALTDTTADYSNGLKTALANIIGKSLTPTSAEISGKYEDTFDVNEKFKFNVSGDTSWSVVSGTAVTLSGTTATIVESGTVTLRFSAYGGQLTKDVTLTVTCQMFSIKGYGGGDVAAAPAFSINETTNFVKGAFYINDTTNTTNGKMILNGEEKVVFQGGDYNPGNGLYQFTSLVSGITLSVGDVITLEKGTTFSQGDSVYYLSETTCLKYYNANNWVVYTVDGEITLNAYTGNASMAANQPAFSINGETKFEAGWFYINNTAQNTNGNMLLNGEEKVVFKAGYYYTDTNSYQFKTLADGITFSEGDVITLKKGTTFSQGVGTIVYVLSKNVDLTYTGTSWTVENYDGKISVSNYYGGAVATGPAFCLDGGKTATNFVKGAFYINDTTNTTNGKMILNGEEKVVFQGGDYNPDNGAYQFVNRADGITLSVGDVITLKKGTTFSQGSLVYVFSKDVYLTCTDAVGQGSWAVNDEQTFTLNEEKDAYAYTDNLVDNLVIGATLAIDGDEAVDVIVHGGITVDGSAAALTAQYYPSISKFVLTGEGLTGSVAIAAGTIFVINGEAYVLEKDFSCDVSEIFIDNANASYYTFADMAPRGTKALIQEYYDMGLSTYQLTQDCHQMVYNDALDSSYLAAIDNAYQLGGSTIIRNIGNLGKNGSNEYIYKDGSTNTTYDKDKIDKITATAKYFDDYGKALMDACDDKISAFYMADEFTSEEFAQLGDLITWKNENASDKLWHMNLVGSLSYDHWEVSYSGSWLESITNKVNREKAQATYGTHVDDYINTIVKNLNGGTASVCLDCYPFRERDEETGVGDIYDYYLFDLLTAATKTKAYNDSRTDTTNSAEARFGICLQTYQFINPSSSALQRDIASSAEVSMQIYTGLAMGADLFQYFTYCSQYYEDGSVKTNGIMTQTPFDGNGGTTIADSKRLYDMVKTANGNALPFAKITSAFDWQGTFYTAGSTSENGTAFGRIGDLVTSNKGAMTSCSSTFDALYGRYTKSSQDGFMVVNYTDPTKAHTNTVTMNFSGYNYAIVYTAGGTAKLVALNSDGGLSLSLATGEAAFVIPMK